MCTHPCSCPYSNKLMSLGRACEKQSDGGRERGGGGEERIVMLYFIIHRSAVEWHVRVCVEPIPRFSCVLCSSYALAVLNDANIFDRTVKWIYARRLCRICYPCTLTNKTKMKKKSHLYEYVGDGQGSHESNERMNSLNILNMISASILAISVRCFMSYTGDMRTAQSSQSVIVV